MAKEVAKRAKDDKLFDEVVMAVVSQNRDLSKIQGQIAEMLGLQLVEENPLVRAERLNNRLSMDSKSVLVILEDVWDALDLEAVGIPYGEKDSCECSTAISLVSKELKRHPDGLECPKLDLLQLSCDKDTLQTLPPNLFKGMNGLMVLSLINMSFPSLPQLINVLQNLRTLQFVDCELTDVSAIGALTKLEILSFFASEIMELPGEIGNPSYLKLLDLTRCYDLQRIPPGLLLSLSHLEELYMFGVPLEIWEPMEGNKEEEEEEGNEEEEEANTCLTEIMSLSHHLMA
ncbi:disease resistance protein rps5 [Quercus suber]|uniref:Disease resistance protein rps5 n=1 Tax=Quercus suber TaxID=58331 RepID=A0AAW0JT12_QUESU